MPSTAEQAAPASRTQGRIYIPALDGVRGVAAATIFIFHYGGGARSSNFAIHFIGETVKLGWTGVSLFFVLSGFLITGILWDTLGNEKWWRTFYIRRSLRIFPLYYLALTGAACVSLLLARWSTTLPVWPYYLYLQDFSPLVQVARLSPVFEIGHFWSLAVEEQFYLIWPFLLLLAARCGREKQLCVTVWIVSLLFRISIFAFHLDPYWATGFLVGRAGELAAGAFLALSLRGSERERSWVFRGAKPLFLASLAGVAGILLLKDHPAAFDAWMGTLGIACFSILFTVLITLCLRPGAVQAFFKLSVLRWLGKISYGIYIYHMLLHPLFASIVHWLFPTLTGQKYLVVLAVVALAGTISVAALSFALFESTFLRLKDTLARSRPGGNFAMSGDIAQVRLTASDSVR